MLGSTSAIASFTWSSQRLSAMTFVRPAAWRASASAVCCRVPTVELLPLDVDGDNGSAHDPRVLCREVSEASNTEDGNTLGGHDRRDFERLAGSHSGAAQKRSINWRDAIGHAGCEASRPHGVFGEGTVNRIAAVQLSFAEGLAPVGAVPAPATGESEPGDGDAVVESRARNALTEFLHDADPFVSWHEGECRLDRLVAISGVDVGVAQSTGLRVYQYLADSRFGHEAVFHCECLTECGDDGGFHRGVLRLGVSFG